MKKTRCALCYAVLAVCFALLLAVSVGTGSAALSPHEILRILLLREGAGTAAYNVLLKIRLPGRMCWACPPAQSWLSVR